ncbi:MAG: archemetzincin, partial [Archaeoglobaceae archaeon]
MIYLQPLGSYPNLIETLALELEKKFYSIAGNVKIMPLRELDKYCYNPFRKQYNSTCLLFRLEKRWITLGITEVDIYADNMNFVFGEAEIFGSRALVS